MASISTPKNSPFFYHAGKDAAGKRYCRSTGILYCPRDKEGNRLAAEAESNRRQAVIFANLYEETLRGTGDVRQKRKMLGELSKQMTFMNGNSEISCRDYLETWKARKAQTVTAGTFRQVNSVINRFVKWIGARADLPVAQITSDDIQDFILRLEARRLQSVTINHHIAWIDAAFSQAERQNLILLNPVDPDDYVEEISMPRKPLTLEQIQDILKTCSHEWQTAVLFAYLCGMRLGDCIARRWSEVNLDNANICWIPQKAARQNKIVTLPLHPTLLERLRKMLWKIDPKEDYITPELARRAKPTLADDVRRLFQKAGIDRELVRLPSGRHFAQIGFHSLRHSYISMLNDQGVSEEYRMLLAAHSTSKAHTRYTHTTVEHLRRAIHLLPPPEISE